MEWDRSSPLNPFQNLAAQGAVRRRANHEPLEVLVGGGRGAALGSPQWFCAGSEAWSTPSSRPVGRPRPGATDVRASSPRVGRRRARECWSRNPRRAREGARATMGQERKKLRARFAPTSMIARRCASLLSVPSVVTWRRSPPRLRVSAPSRPSRASTASEIVLFVRVRGPLRRWSPA